MRILKVGHFNLVRLTPELISNAPAGQSGNYDRSLPGLYGPAVSDSQSSEYLRSIGEIRGSFFWHWLATSKILCPSSSISLDKLPAQGAEFLWANKKRNYSGFAPRLSSLDVP
jgi:hypothetical protein